jgi:folate-binding protein YgfZ
VPDGTRDIEIDKGLLMENHFEALNGVDFRKGCYVGQELTARTKHRGLVKKKLYRVRALNGEPLPGPETPITLEGAEAGALRSASGAQGLALLRIEMVEKAANGAGKLEAGPVVLEAEAPGSHYAGTPHIGQWLKNGDRTMRVVTACYPELSREERLEITSEENVLVQMENLRTYPVVLSAAKEGRLHVHAWFFEIRTGCVYRYSPEKEQYEPIRDEGE